MRVAGDKFDYYVHFCVAVRWVRTGRNRTDADGAHRVYSTSNNNAVSQSPRRPTAGEHGGKSQKLIDLFYLRMSARPRSFARAPAPTYSGSEHITQQSILT